MSMTDSTFVNVADAPIVVEAPQVSPASGGLYAATSWADTAAGAASRFLIAGVEIRPHNYGGESAFGVWDAPWCVNPDSLAEDDLKTGERPGWLDAFLPVTTWAYDECDLTAPSQAEVRARAAHNLELLEPVAVEREFAARLLLDAGAPTATPTLAQAVGHLEEAFAATSTLGVIHARSGLLAVAESTRLILRDPGAPGVLRTPAGHRWVFGGGYAAAGPNPGLGDTLVATSPTFGWRDQVALRETVKYEWNRFVAIAERSVVVGYEAAIGAAVVTP